MPETNLIGPPRYAVAFALVEIGEGETVPGTVLYDQDSALAGIKLYLDPGPAQYHSGPYSKMLGDRDSLSSLAPMQQLAPRVYQIFLDFEV
jgi:hypothetical protein